MDFVQDAYSAIASLLLTFLNRYGGACTHVAKRLSGKGSRSKTGCVAAGSQAEN